MRLCHTSNEEVSKCEINVGGNEMPSYNEAAGGRTVHLLTSYSVTLVTEFGFSYSYYQLQLSEQN